METLYRKYRPKNFSEVEGQAHIVRTLKNAISAKRVSHAYLFTGPRGTGKTTLARIFSLALNCLDLKNGNPCEKCASCVKILNNTSLSIIEIDAASHTGVDNIRQLREEATLPPMDGGRYKIYIIDEVHMLSKGAFNALLKILEEPPKHIIFILATTEIQKVPETILSRCQRFDFGRLPLKNIIEKLTRIAKAEKVELEPEVVEMVAIASAGGMRDAESLLSQLFSANDKNITVQEAEEILGFSHRSTARAFVTALVENNIPIALRHIGEASDNGYNLDHFIESVLYQLRRMLFLRVSPELSKELKNEMTEEELKTTLELVKPLTLSWIVRAIDTLLTARISMKSSFLPQIPLETAVIKIIDTTPSSVQAPTPHKPASPQSETPMLSSEKTTPSQSAPNKENTIKQNPSPSSHTTPTPPKIAETNRQEKKKECSPQPSKTFTLEDVFPIWQKCLDQTQEKNTLLGTFLGGSTVVRAEKNALYITTSSQFYKSALERKENRLTIESILGILLDTRVSLRISVEEPAEEKPDPLIQDVLEAFGNAVA